MKKQHTKKAAHPASSSVKPTRTRMWIAGVLVVLVSAAVLWWPDTRPVPSATPSSHPVAPRIGQENLAGRWVRSDGGYVLEIRNALPDGQLEAVYYNPNPIHVGRARWEDKDGTLTVVVELRDVNYPGSTYTLTAAADHLRGNYFQAVDGVNYAVEFVRDR